MDKTVKTQDETGRMGFLLSKEHTVKLIQLAKYMNKSTYEVILFHIDQLYEIMIRCEKEDGHF